MITLGIIGVVAALTMPALIANHRKTVAETRLAKFYSSMNQAVKRAEADYGDVNQWDKWVTNTKYFDKYFEPYISYTKIQYDGGMAVVYFPDGSLATFKNIGISFYPNAKDYSLKEEENGQIRGNQEYSGVKSFVFFFNPTENTTTNKYHYNQGIEPYKWGWDGNKATLLNNNSLGCKKEVSNSRAYCTALIQMNGWKIPKDYPLKF